MKKFSLLILLFCVGFSGCKKDKKSEPRFEPNVRQIKGRVVFPSEFSNTNSYSIISHTSKAEMKQQDFIIDTTGITNTNLFLLNISGEPLMMRYITKGQSNYDISVQSTAIAMIMTTPVVQSLSETGKVNLMSELTKNPKLQSLAEEISKSVSVGKSFTEIGNQELSTAFKNLFNSILNTEETPILATSPTERTATSTISSISSDFDDPVGIYRVGNKVTFVNRGVATYYAIGIYKDGIKKDKLILNGISVVPASLSDLYKVLTNPDTTLSQQTYTLAEEGKYEIKIRSGRPTSGDETTESDDARMENLSQMLIANLNYVIPLGDKCSEIGLKKGRDVLSTSLAYNKIENASITDQALFIFEIFHGALQSFFDILKDCAKEIVGEPTNKYLIAIKKYFHYIDIVSRTGAAMNLSHHLYSWNHSKPAYNLCYEVKGNKITICNNDPNEGWCNVDVMYLQPRTGWVTWQSAGSNASFGDVIFIEYIEGSFQYCSGETVSGTIGARYKIKKGIWFSWDQYDTGCSAYPAYYGQDYRGRIGPVKCP